MPWSHTRPETGPGLHDDPAPPKSPLSSGAGRFLMRPDAGAVQKRHPELDPALLGEEQQALPHTPRARGGPKGGGSGPPATTAPAHPEWPAAWLHSHAARRSPTACAADPEAASYPGADTPQPTAPSSSSARPTALPSPHSRKGKTPVITIGSSANRP